MLIIGVTRLFSHPVHHHCADGHCDHQHAKSVLRGLASFGVVCLSVFAGSALSRDAFDQRIVTNRGSIEDDRSLPGISNTGFPSNALRPVAFNGTTVRQNTSPLPSSGSPSAESSDGSAHQEVALEITDLLRARTIEPLRNFIAGKNVAVVGQFVFEQDDEELPTHPHGR